VSDGSADLALGDSSSGEPGRLLAAAIGIGRRYGHRDALEPTDLEVRAGEAVFLVGPNGAGKSTLLAILAGALPPSCGRVDTDLSPREIGWAPQRPAQYRHLTARENLVLFARLQAVGNPDGEAARMLAEVELADDRRRASQLSVGNQQRLNLALCFLGGPQLLLLDEPTASLDPPQARALWRRLDEARHRGVGAVVATHLLDETTHADRVLVLREGRVVFAGDPATFRESEWAA
jgi:ABC-type multidrug transport system ATPase subunit